MAATEYAQKSTRDRVTGAARPGPLHVLVQWGGPLQSLCGKRLKGLAVVTMFEPSGPVCPTCARHLTAGTSQSWSSR